MKNNQTIAVLNEKNAELQKSQTILQAEIDSLKAELSKSSEQYESES